MREINWMQRVCDGKVEGQETRRTVQTVHTVQMYIENIRKKTHYITLYLSVGRPVGRPVGRMVGRMVG